ncbi:MAG: TIGR01777 family oxidoreductase [Balneolaceae bacterium]
MNRHYLITGGTGFIGSHLCRNLLQQGGYVTVLTRSPAKYREEQSRNQKFVSWDSDLNRVMNEADMVIHLAGENLFSSRWTKKVKQSLYDSRIETTNKLVEAMISAENPPELLVSASGINIYGDHGDRLIDEKSGAGDDFLAQLCIDWEAAAHRAKEAGVRVAIPRFGIVLQKDGGALEQLKWPYHFFIGGPLGSGQQYLSWIHMEDLCRALLWPLEQDGFRGVYNACSPSPVTMRELADSIGNVLNRPSFFRVPEPLLRWVLGEAAKPITGSVRAVPGSLVDSGFQFQFGDLNEALADLL